MTPSDAPQVPDSNRFERAGLFGTPPRTAIPPGGVLRTVAKMTESTEIESLKNTYVQEGECQTLESASTTDASDLTQESPRESHRFNGSPDLERTLAPSLPTPALQKATSKDSSDAEEWFRTVYQARKCRTDTSSEGKEANRLKEVTKGPSRTDASGEGKRANCLKEVNKGPSIQQRKAWASAECALRHALAKHSKHRVSIEGLL